MASDQENLARAVSELQVLERAMSELQSRIATLQAVLGEYDGAISLLEELQKQKSEVKMLVPIGGGNFLQAEIKEVEAVQVSLGAGIVMKQPIQEGYELIKKRREQISRIIEQYQNTLIQYAQRAEELRRLVEALSARIRAQMQQKQEAEKR